MNPKIKEEAIEQLKKDVLFGFEGESELFESIREMFYDEDDFDEEWLKAEIAGRLKEHLDKSLTWKSPTDFEKLVEVFDQLNEEGIVSLHKAGYTRQDGEGDCLGMMEELKAVGIKTKGYCYYHTQDLEGVIEGGGGLFIGYDGLEQNDDLAKEVAKRVVELLRQNGFDVKWEGSIDTRIELTAIKWEKIPDSIDYGYGRILGIMVSHQEISGKKKPFWKFW